LTQGSGIRSAPGSEKDNKDVDMKAGRASRTAEGVAAVRAKHTLHDRPKIFDDPWAISLIGPAWRVICRSRWLSRIIFDGVYRALRPSQATVVGRARFLEDALDRAITRHTVDYVVIGAGFDSFALRQQRSARPRHVWEVDHPDTQLAKQRRLAALGVRPPTNVHFVPADLSTESLPAVLTRHGFVPGGIAFFSMLGLSYYLPRDVLLRMIESLAGDFPSGSELVVDIRIDPKFLSPAELPAFRRVERLAARRGEKMLTRFHPGDFVNACRDLGMELVECLSPAQQTLRYFADRRDGLAATPDLYVLHFRSV
jgi:methyltransferase (TIGR00027 family)